MRIAAILVLAIVGTSATTHAITLTNVDFVGGAPSLTLPASYTVDSPSPGVFQTVDGLFDGETGNPGNGRFVVRQNGGAPLSSTNFVSINVDLLKAFDVDAVQLAHDWGNAASQEVTNMEVLFSNAGGLISSISASGLNDGNINDIDDIGTSLNVSGVTSIEFRITGGEGNPHVLEIRELLVTGEFTIPEPATATLGLLGIVGMAARRRRVA